MSLGTHDRGARPTAATVPFPAMRTMTRRLWLPGQERAARGIGKAIALKLAREGARVVINDIDAGPAEETLAELRGIGAQATACIGDVTQADFGERFVGTAVREFGGLDIVINNTGYT